MSDLRSQLQVGLIGRQGGSLEPKQDRNENRRTRAKGQSIRLKIVWAEPGASEEFETGCYNAKDTDEKLRLRLKQDWTE